MELENVQAVFSMVRVGGLFTALLTLGLTYLAGRFVRATFDRLGQRITERRLHFQQLSSFARFAIYFVGIFLSVISAVELRQETVIALSGTAGIALGFALKDLATSVLAGLTILIDKPFQVGDRVKVGDVYGDVDIIGLRSVRIVTLDDNLVTIPNSRFLTEAVASGNAGELHMLVQMDFFIGMDQDLEQALKLTEEAVTSSRYAYLERPWNLLVNQVCEGETFAVRIRANVYVMDTQHEKVFLSEVNRRLITAFQDANILPPATLTRTVDTHERRQSA